MSKSAATSIPKLLREATRIVEERLRANRIEAPFELEYLGEDDGWHSVGVRTEVEPQPRAIYFYALAEAAVQMRKEGLGDVELDPIEDSDIEIQSPRSPISRTRRKTTATSRTKRKP